MSTWEAPKHWTGWDGWWDWKFYGVQADGAPFVADAEMTDETMVLRSEAELTQLVACKEWVAIHSGELVPQRWCSEPWPAYPLPEPPATPSLLACLALVAVLHRLWGRRC